MLLDFFMLEKVDPFIQRVFRHIVKLIDLDQVVLRVERAHRRLLKQLLLFFVQLELIVFMQAGEHGFARGKRNPPPGPGRNTEC